MCETITKEELRKKLTAEDPIQVVNVLPPKYYDLGSIKGSQRIPVSEIEKKLYLLDKSKEIVTYCASYDSHDSRKAAEILNAIGFRVKAYAGGIQEWKESGLPLERIN